MAPGQRSPDGSGIPERGGDGLFIEFGHLAELACGAGAVLPEAPLLPSPRARPAPHRVPRPVHARGGRTAVISASPRAALNTAVTVAALRRRRSGGSSALPRSRSGGAHEHVAAPRNRQRLSASRGLRGGQADNEGSVHLISKETARRPGRPDTVFLRRSRQPDRPRGAASPGIPRTGAHMDCRPRAPCMIQEGQIFVRE